MSAYTVVELKFTDGDCIKAALSELGYVFEEHKHAQTLYGVGGSARPESAHIIVRRNHVGAAANDVGFLKKSDGSYEMIISEFDRSGKKKQAVDFMEKLKQLYGKHKVIKQAKRMGFAVSSTKTTKDGKLKIRIRT